MFKTVESNEEADITEKKSKFIDKYFLYYFRRRSRGKNKTNKKKA